MTVAIVVYKGSKLVVYRMLTKEMECLFEDLLKEVLEHDSKKAEKEINRLAFKLYNLSPAEINYITEFVTQSQQSQ